MKPMIGVRKAIGMVAPLRSPMAGLVGGVLLRMVTYSAKLRGDRHDGIPGNR
jgi:hypothetical protein